MISKFEMERGSNPMLAYLNDDDYEDSVGMRVSEDDGFISEKKDTILRECSRPNIHRGSYTHCWWWYRFYPLP